MLRNPLATIYLKMTLVVIIPVAVEKLALHEFAEIASRQEALQTIFLNLLDIFYRPIFDFFQKNRLFQQPPLLSTVIPNCSKLLAFSRPFEVKYDTMERHFRVGHLSVERLLTEWRWLCPQAVTLIARNAFGDLFLRDDSGTILKLDVAVGVIEKVAESEVMFRALASTIENRKKWFAEDDEMAAVDRGLKANAHQSIAFKIPLQLAEGGGPSNAYVADLYEQVSFLGDLNRQTSHLRDGSKVRLQPKQ
jgi:hypothetical protein